MLLCLLFVLPTAALDDSYYSCEDSPAHRQFFEEKDDWQTWFDGFYEGVE